ncbi:MAG: CoA pyrophosphatase [Myxococcota bacterium]
MPTVNTLDAVRGCLENGTADVDFSDRKMSAAVALVLRERAGDLEALFIRRADHEGDPWSGHLAFPGGRIDPGDVDARAAAERETLEELGLALSNARPLGQLSDVLGRAESIRVSAFVYAVEGDPDLVPNYEVREAFWSPLSQLTDEARQEEREFGYQEQSMPLPCIRLLENERAPVLWGITYKFMDDFMAKIGRPIPFMPWDEHDL